MPAKILVSRALGYQFRIYELSVNRVGEGRIQARQEPDASIKFPVTSYRRNSTVTESAGGGGVCTMIV